MELGFGGTRIRNAAMRMLKIGKRIPLQSQWLRLNPMHYPAVSSSYRAWSGNLGTDIAVTSQKDRALQGWMALACVGGAVVR